MNLERGARVDERTQVFMTTVLGAAVGGVLGCLYLTQRGQRVRLQLESFFDNVIEEIHQIEQTVDKARVAVDEGRRAIDDVLRPAGGSWKSRDSGETSQARQAR